MSAGIAHKRGGRGHAYYWIDRKSVTASLGLGEKLPVFLVWGDIFRAFDMVISDRWDHGEAYESEFLSAERMRDLSLKIIPVMRRAGEPLSRLPAPDHRRLKGMEHMEALMEFMDSAVSVLKLYAIE